MTLATEQEFPYFLTTGMMVRGWALAAQGQVEEGIARMQQGLTAWRATGAELGRSHYLALLAEAYGKAGQIDEGLNIVAEALVLVDNTGECVYEAELYRLKGELLRSRSEWEKGHTRQDKPGCPLIP
jgi:predicted ATPase